MSDQQQHLRDLLQDIKYYINEVEKAIYKGTEPDKINKVVIEANTLLNLVLKLNDALLQIERQTKSKLTYEGTIEDIYISDFIAFLKSIGYIEGKDVNKLCKFIREVLKEMK